MTQKENREQNSGGWPSWPRTLSLPREAEPGRPTAKRRALCSGSKPATVFPLLCSVTLSLKALSADFGLRLKELMVWNCWGRNMMDPTSQSYGWSFLGVSGNKGTGETREERKAFWKGLWRLCRSLSDQVKKLVSTFWTFLCIYLYSTYWKHYGILHAIHSSPSGSRNFIHLITVFYPPSSSQMVLLLSRCIISHTHTTHATFSLSSHLFSLIPLPSCCEKQSWLAWLSKCLYARLT